MLNELVTTLLVLSGGRREKYKCIAGVSSSLCNRITVMYPVRMKSGGKKLEKLLP